MVRTHASLAKDEEINEASWVAAQGAAVGAAKWGAFSAVAAGLGLALSPIYRGLTVQMKVFLQMSGMTFGAIVEADRRLIQHEKVVRRRKQIARDAHVWQMYEEDYQRHVEQQQEPSMKEE
ncbi:hypothetical protein DOTSEDRAFT_72531 [Lecanosticta acicola]|uniref:Imidazoleglycerol-phosphate dehydratase n=1 Tax=Lecanosticta acicola TaxID=111012 RepID=A0AAI8YT15_9PEZI|nr:hypothetical protein DOTSEDRAFT_72531 [Lecanosticta acicola]